MYGLILEACITKPYMKTCNENLYFEIMSIFLFLFSNKDLTILLSAKSEQRAEQVWIFWLIS